MNNNKEEPICQFSQYLDDTDITNLLKHFDTKLTRFLLLILKICKYIITIILGIILILDLLLLFLGSTNGFKETFDLIMVSILVLLFIKNIHKIEFNLFRIRLKIKYERVITLFKTYILFERNNLKLKILFDDIEGIYRTEELLFIKTNKKYVMISQKQISDEINIMLNYLKESFPDKFHNVNSDKFKLKKNPKIFRNLKGV
jgi:hypothetical protein